MGFSEPWDWDRIHTHAAGYDRGVVERETDMPAIMVDVFPPPKKRRSTWEEDTMKHNSGFAMISYSFGLLLANTFCLTNLSA